MKPEQALKEFLKTYDAETPENLIIKGKRIYQASEKLKETAKKIPQEYFSIGIPIGEIKGKNFKPSFELLDRIKKTNNKVIINEEGEWMFICGRDVFEKNIIKKGEVKKEFLVMNEKEEVLGIGELRREKKKTIIKNKLDRGDFLRREEKRKKKKKQ